MIPTTESVTSLARQWAAGDRRAGSELIARHDGWIVARARRATKPGEDSSDLAQVMRLGFLRGAAECSSGSDGILRHKLTLRMRDAVWEMRQKYVPLPSSTYDIDELVADHPDEEGFDFGDRLERANLSDLQRRVATMLLAGCSGLDIARELKIHPMTAARRTAQTLKRLSKTKGTELAILPSEKRPVPEERGMRIVEILSKAGPLTGPVIQEMLGCSSEMTRTALRALMAAGKVTWTGTPNRRVYEIAEQKPVAA